MIITNYGSSATGKSTFSASLAMAIAQANPRATILLINYSTDVPMHAIWETSREIPRTYSMGYLFENEEIDQKALVKSIVTLNDNKNIGTLSFCLGDSPLSYKDIEYKQVIQMLKAAEQLVDYVIVDCGSNLLKDETAASIEMANCLNVFLSPDPNGVVYLKTARLMYENNPKFMVGNTNYLIGPCRTFHAVKEMKEALGIKAYEIPYNNEIAVKNCEGNIFGVYKASPRKYKSIIKKILASTNINTKKLKNVDDEEVPAKANKRNKKSKKENTNSDIIENSNTKIADNGEE